MRSQEMEILFISKKQFKLFRKFLPAPGNAEKIDARTALSCAIWVIKGAYRWSDIPKKYGNFDSIRKRFSRWSKNGLFRKAFSALVKRARKRSEAMVDSTTVKVHRTAASLKSDGLSREIGRSVGGLTTKIHFLATTDKIPLDFSLTGGQVSDSREGEKLIRKNIFRFKTLLADKAYDTDSIRKFLSEERKKVCIPPKSNRKNPPPFDPKQYKKRSTIENMFSRLKDWRGIAMRFCRSVHMFDSFVCVALITIFSDVR